ncbi:iron export ABC transporter permease subunit FetB [soil metagenome]
MTIWVILLTIAILAAITVVIVLVLHLEQPWLQPWAILRATMQLGILTLILSSVIRSDRWVAVFLCVMVLAASWVVFRRLRVAWRYLPLFIGSIAFAAAIPGVVVFATGAVPFSPRYVLAVGGIVIGNTMTVSTLMGRSMVGLLVAQRDEIEAWLSVGATPRRAARRAIRSAASTSLIPSTDQTRTTGIVTLPGAFVGAVFAGASPLAAAEFQLIVLAAILTAGAVTVGVFTVIFGAPRYLPLEEASLGHRSVGRANP